MSNISSKDLCQIPLPTDKDVNIRPPVTKPIQAGGALDLKGIFQRIQLDDIILFGLIILLATDDDCDNFLLVLLVFIFLAGIDKQLLPFLSF